MVYGSVARGDEEAGSDLDLAVSIADDRPLSTVKLSGRLERVTGRRVDIPRIDALDANAPLLMDRILEEGRVLIDRDGLWPRLLGRRRAIRARADRAYRKQMSEAATTIGKLTR